MRRFARIGDAHFIDRKARHGDEVDTGGMHHHGGIERIKRALSRHQLFAIAAFLGRCAEIAHLARQVAVQFGERQRCAEAGGGDDVVTAGMADTGQGVIFG